MKRKIFFLGKSQLVAKILISHFSSKILPKHYVRISRLELLSTEKCRNRFSIQKFFFFQSFVQALQRKALTPNPCDQGDMNTLQSDSTHLSHLPSDQTAQLAALTESEDDLNDSRDISANVTADSQSTVNFVKNYRQLSQLSLIVNQFPFNG